MDAKFNVDKFITSLLSVRSKKNKTVKLKEKDIMALCSRVKQIFKEQPLLLELEAPLKVCGKRSYLILFDIFIGDIHGQYKDLIRLFEYGGFPPESNYLFLGDYVDRGQHNIECICLLFAYKVKYPYNFFLLRGNHEC